MKYISGRNLPSKYTGFVQISEWVYFVYKGKEAPWNGVNDTSYGCGWQESSFSSPDDKNEYIKKQLGYYEENKEVWRILTAELLGAK
jgi:hypothetical protein